MAAVLYGTRIPHIFYRCHVYRNHKYMCNRACDSCYGNSLDSGRQDYYSCPDPDRRCGTDFPGQYYFYKSEKENIAEEPACYPGVLQYGQNGWDGQAGEESSDLCVWSRRNRCSVLCSSIYSAVRSGKRSGILCFYGSICIL